MKRTAVIGMLILASAVVACSSETSAEDGSSLACDHFRNVASDVADGVLTDEEMRQKLKEIDDNAIIGTPAVQAAARETLRASTAADLPALTDAVRAMGSACTASGH